MSLDEEYSNWVASVQPDLRKIFSILQKRLSDEPVLLMRDMTEAEAWTARCSYILSQANSFLDKWAPENLPPKDETTRELDRKAILEAAQAPIREMRDKIEGLSESLHTRISLGQSLLKWYTVNSMTLGER